MDETEQQQWFSSLKKELENAYLQHSEPWKQSGFSGPEERWIAYRKPIVDCIEKSGSFLDIGCANGYLLECILRLSHCLTSTSQDLLSVLFRYQKTRLLCLPRCLQITQKSWLQTESRSIS